MELAPEVIAASITGICTVLAAGIAAIAAAVIGKRFLNQETLRAQRDKAFGDIEFLLAVEEAHCSLHKAKNGESNKIRVRSRVARERQLEWSGKFTPSRAKPL